MTDYCDKKALYQNIAGLTDDNKKAPAEFLEDLISRKSAHINAMVGDRYVVPIVESKSPISFKILNDVCIELCRDPIAKKLNIATPESSPDQHPEMTASERMGHPESILRRMRKGIYTLPDAVPCSSKTCGLFQSGSYDTSEVEGIPYSSSPNYGRGYVRINR